jgi:GxxExxY protein
MGTTTNGQRKSQCILTTWHNYAQESYDIVGACFEVYKTMGRGFLEPVYQECLEIELSERGIPFLAQRQLQIVYKGRILEQIYKPDFVCYEKIILEVKAVTKLADAHRAQFFNYLRSTGMRLGMLVNFSSHPKLEYERIVL